MEGQALDRAIEGAQRGESASLEALVDLFAGRVFGFLYRMTGSRHDAEDLMQEVFIRLVRTIASYQHEGRFEAWLFRIAANLARDRIRRARRHRRSIAGADSEATSERVLDELAGVQEPPDRGLIRDEEIDRLNAALAELPEAEREVVMLRHFTQLSFRQIAEATAVPLGTALARGHRGLRRLRDLLCSDERERALGHGIQPVGTKE